MSKIDEFEQKIIKHGMTDEDFLEYGKLLKRVRGNLLKRQHCYTTAIQFSDEYAEQAVKLIQYGLENFEDGWFSTYTSYLYIGHIYEKARNSAYEIIERKRATYYGIAMAVKRICECIIRNEQSILPVSSMMHGIYG